MMHMAPTMFRRTVLVALVMLLPASGFATVITAMATGSTTPTITMDSTPVMNGDFLITTPSAPVVGDGINETTEWTFDFTGDPDFGSFSTGDPLTSATLMMSLTPRNGLITTDFVRIAGLPSIITPTIQTLPVGPLSMISIELLDFYTSDQILGAFSAATLGEIEMVYRDDAIVSFAKLELNNMPVPASSLLMLMGLAALVGHRRRIQ